MGTEIFIDSGCATFAEIRKRTEDFWGEFEFYVSDLVIGMVRGSAAAAAASLAAHPPGPPSRRNPMRAHRDRE